MRLIRLTAIMAAFLLPAVLSIMPAHAQGVTRLCVNSVNSTTGNNNCQDVSSSNPFPVTGSGGTFTFTWPGTAGLTNYGTAPGSGTVPNINAYVTNPISATITWPGTATPTNYGTAPTGTVPGVNADVTNVNANGQATMANSSPVVIASDQSTLPVTQTPSSSSTIGLTPVVSASAESSHVLDASPGNAYSVYATNLTSTAGFLVLLNATSAPSDGAITPLACAPLSPNGVASLNYAPGPPGVFSTGIVAVVTSASTCFTKTTGVITAFISGSVK